VTTFTIAGVVDGSGNPVVFTAGTTAATIPGVGTITIGTDGDYTFTPLTSWNGTVPTVTYSLSDDAGVTVGDTSTLIITVTPVNDVPLDPNDSHTVTEDTTLTIAANAGLLVGATDPEGDTLTITDFTVNGVTYPVSAATPSVALIANVGTLTINADGSYSFTPATGYTGAIPVATYTISDGHGGTDTSTLTLTMASSYVPSNQGQQYVGYQEYPRLIEQKPIELGHYEFNTVVLDFNGQFGGINQFSPPMVETTSTRGDLEYSNHTPYYSFDRVGDEVDNTKRSLDVMLAVTDDSDFGLCIAKLATDETTIKPDNKLPKVANYVHPKAVLKAKLDVDTYWNGEKHIAKAHARDFTHGVKVTDKFSHLVSNPDTKLPVKKVAFVGKPSFANQIKTVVSPGAHNVDSAGFDASKYCNSAELSGLN
jgi:VCBS repeat-containing protein